jgi:flagellar biosynthesis GTPase FlhF
VIVHVTERRSVRYFSGETIRHPDRLLEGDVWTSKGLRFEGGVWVPYRKRSNALDNDWTAAEDAKLREYFAAVYASQDKRTLKEFAAEFGRSVGACHTRAGKKLGILQQREIKGGFCTTPKWTDEEHALLDQWYPKVPIGEVVKLLPGRSKSAVFARANQRGLVSPYAQHYRGWTNDEQRALRIAYKRGIAIADLAFAVGRSPLTASKYATNHGLDFGRRPLLAVSPSLEVILSLEDENVPVPALLSRAAMRPSKIARRRPVVTSDKELRRREREKLASRRKYRRLQRIEERRRERNEAKAKEKAARAAERQAMLEERRRQREQEREISRAQRIQAGRDRATQLVNARRSQAAKATARKKAQKILETGELIGRVRNPEIKFAYQALLREQERERRQSDPIEQAKIKLQRRYAPVCSMAIYGGPKHLYVIGQRRNVSEQELLALAEKVAA